MTFQFELTDDLATTLIDGNASAVTYLEDKETRQRLAGALLYIGEGRFETAAQLLLDIEAAEHQRVKLPELEAS